MNLRIVFLGTGAAVPGHRGLPCIAVRADSTIYLLDVGEGCQGRLVRSGLSPLKVKAIFVTHMHGDHYWGLFGLLQTMHLNNRREPLVVVGPRELLTLMKYMLDERMLRLGFELNLEELNASYKFNDGKVHVEAYPVCHNIEAYGFRLEFSRRTLSYTGDTKPCDSVVKNSEGVDLLIHEATFTSESREEAIGQGHSTAADAAISAAKANAKMLALTHISARYRNSSEVFYDAYRYFDNVLVAQDYQVLYF
ncbi:MAG: ribonuclease Z [Desulfurococcaceae archaeon]